MQPNPGQQAALPGQVPPAAHVSVVAETTDETKGPLEPIHMDPPTQEEIEQNEVLMQQIQYTIESAKLGEVRAGVLVRLEKLIRTWMAKLLRAKGYANPDDHGGRLLTFGSYKLGVHFPGADIDTLCIAPRDVDREDFFDTLVNILRKHTLVKELNPVKDAHVPVIKMKFDDVQIDLVFSALDLDRIPPSPPFNIGADTLLRNLDDASQRSINGSRVAEKLLRCVPSTATFRWALRGIKLWAKNRGIYGNIYGFPGGVAWAIMTACVCQLYPKSPPGVILKNFFKYYKTVIKEEGNNNPIYLTKTLEVSSDIGKKSWDRKNNQFEIFPIITPMPPYMNSCYNVGRSNLRILCQEFRRGYEVLQRNDGKGKRADWSDLWAPSDFFLRYKVFLQIEVSAMDNTSFNSWSAYVESKLRHLVASLETWPQYSDVHEIAKTSYQIEIRVWPFLFQNTNPNDRLLFTEESAAAMSRDRETCTSTPPTVSTREEEKPETPSAALSDELITGYFFIGLDTCEANVADGDARQIIDFEGAVDQFYQQLFWGSKTEKMLPPNITLVKRRHVPEWVLSEYEREQLKIKEMGLAVRLASKRNEREQRKQDKGAKKRKVSGNAAQDHLTEKEGDPPEQPPTPPPVPPAT